MMKMDGSDIVEISIGAIILYVIVVVALEILDLSTGGSDFAIQIVFWVIVGGIIAMFIDAAVNGS